MEIQKKKAIKAIKLSILGNFILAVIKGAAGFFGNSYALIADAIESTTDVFSSLIVFLGLRYATKPPDEKHPYGHGKVEPLITFIVVGFLLISATIIAYESIQNIRYPHQAPKPFTLIVLAVIIIAKEIFYRITKEKGDETQSTSLKADAWHHRSDALTSLVAFIGISIALFMGKGYEAADDWAALVASGIIVFNAYLIFRPALGEIMEENNYNDFIEEIRLLSSKIEGVKGTEKCYVRKAGMTFHVDLHLWVDGTISVSKGHEIAHQVKNKILAEKPEIVDILIHIEPYSIPGKLV